MSTMDEENNLRHRGSSGRGGTFSKYGASLEPPKDDAVYYPDDDTHSFFAQGRDFESAYVNHKYTQKERETLSSFESLDYLPSHSVVYKHWIKRQPARLDWDRWIMMGLIGFIVGIVGFLLHQTIDVIADTKWEKASEYIKDKHLLSAWGFVLGYSVLFVMVSAGMVVFLRPSAGSSGIPELIGFLNGTVVRHIFNIKTMVVKFLSCCCAVGSGMPIGPEGPMIHLGSLVGAGLSQFKSDTLKVKLPFFERFRNSEDRRNFISAGAAAGVASAFGAPVGGLLFSMEEVSSFWNQRLSWQIFFCAMVSTFTTDLFNSAFTGFKYQGDFGLFKAEKYILFQVKKGIAVHILTFIPATLLGVIGGILGALFNFINLKFARLRRRTLARVQSKCAQSTIRMAEPIIIMILISTVSVFLPSAFPCTPRACMNGDRNLGGWNCTENPDHPLRAGKNVNRYTCNPGMTTRIGNYTWTNDTFNEMATLLFNTGEGAIHHLFSRDTHLEFGYPALFSVLPIYFLMACWAAGTSISSGLVVPMLFIGGIYGRIVGRLMVTMFGVHVGQKSQWGWMDPGAFALVGAASFFGGVSRLTMSLTVIMIEITNDVQFLLPIMCAIMVAKWVGDFWTHPIYHALLELKCIPFLDAEPVIRHEGKHMLNLELFSSRDIMTPHPITLSKIEPVAKLAQLLLDYNHGGFPVVRTSSRNSQVFHGFINRLELTVLLRQEDLFLTKEVVDIYNPELVPVEYEQMTLDKLSDPAGIQEMLQRYCDDTRFENLFINLDPYVNQSAVSVPDKFSLHRTYIIFRTLGLRHLTVVNEDNQVVGVITRKDLMGFSMEEKLAIVMSRAVGGSGSAVELTATAELDPNTTRA